MATTERPYETLDDLLGASAESGARYVGNTGYGPPPSIVYSDSRTDTVFSRKSGLFACPVSSGSPGSVAPVVLAVHKPISTKTVYWEVESVGRRPVAPHPVSGSGVILVHDEVECASRTQNHFGQDVYKLKGKYVYILDNAAGAGDDLEVGSSQAVSENYLKSLVEIGAAYVLPGNDASSGYLSVSDSMQLTAAAVDEFWEDCAIGKEFFEQGVISKIRKPGDAANRTVLQNWSDVTGV